MLRNGTLFANERDDKFFYCFCGAAARPLVSAFTAAIAKKLQKDFSRREAATKSKALARRGKRKNEICGDDGPPQRRFFIMSQNISQPVPTWKRILFSEVIVNKTRAQKIAYIGIMTALCMVSNMFFSFAMFDIQFSVTLFMSVMSGILIGPLFGAAAAFLGDIIGYLYASWGLTYWPWVGLSCAAMALIAGLIMNGIKFPFKGGIYLKLVIICVLVLFCCTIGISTTGMYFYLLNIGFSEKAISYIAEHFGTGVTFWGYTCFRLFGGQLYNNLFNYVLLFLAVPLLKSIKVLKLDLR